MRKPEDLLHCEIHKIWSDVLKSENFGITDTLYSVGGHSIHALTILARVADRYGIKLKLKDFFEDPTVQGIAEAITKGLAGDFTVTRSSPIMKTTAS
jgi:acyl carrier protein